MNNQIKSIWTPAMHQDLMSYGVNLKGILEYKFKNTFEKNIIKKNFDVEYLTNDTIYFYIDNRKIKLLVLKNDELSKTIKKIISESKTSNWVDILSLELGEAVSKEMDEHISVQILKDFKIGKYSKIEFIEYNRV